VGEGYEGWVGRINLADGGDVSKMERKRLWQENHRGAPVNLKEAVTPLGRGRGARMKRKAAYPGRGPKKRKVWGFTKGKGIVAPKNPKGGKNGNLRIQKRREGKENGKGERLLRMGAKK